MDLQPGAWLGDWQLEAPLGQGGFGRVYRARRADGALAALKVGREPDDVRPAQVEWHPHVVRTLEEHLEHDPPFVVLELVEGGDLRQALRERGAPLPPAEVLAAVSQVASALDHAHQRGVLHLDVKPENVLVDRRAGSFKLTDFGGHRAQRDPATLAHSLRLTADVRVAGTRDYAAPELREADHRLDRRADVYSLGVLAFELLTGRLPLGLDRPSDLRPSLPRAVDQVLERALARAPERRTLSAGALAQDLAGALGGAPPSRDRDPAGPGASRARSRLPVLLALVVALLVGGALYQRLRPSAWGLSGRGGVVASRVAPLLDALPRGARVVVLPPLDLAERGQGPRSRALRASLEDAVLRAGRAPAGGAAPAGLDLPALFVRAAREELERRTGAEAALHAVAAPEGAGAHLFLVDLKSWAITGAGHLGRRGGAAAELGRQAAAHLSRRGGEPRPLAVLPLIDAELGVSNRDTAWLDAELTAALVEAGGGRLPVRARAGIVERLRDAGGDVRRALSVGLVLEGRLDARAGALAAALRDLDSGAVLWRGEAPLSLEGYDAGRDMDRFTVDARAVERALGDRLDRLLTAQVQEHAASMLRAASEHLAQGQPARAVLLLEQLRGRGPAYARQLEPLLLLAQAHGAAGDPVAALSALEEALALWPDDGRVRDLYAREVLLEAERLFAAGKRPWWRDDEEERFREARAQLHRLDLLPLEAARKAQVDRLRRRIEDEL